MKPRVDPALPGIVGITVISGASMAAVLATSFGLLPLYGPADFSADGWASTAPALRASVGESLLIVLPATTLAAVTGFFLAVVVLASGPGAGLIRTSCLLVLALPHLVAATSILLWLEDGGLGARLLGTEQWPSLVGGSLPYATVLELAWKESAFIALVLIAALAPGHRRRMEVAAGLGAGPLQRLISVVAPAALPALGAACLVSLVYAVGSYEIAWLLGRAAPEPLPVLSFRLFGSIELSDRPEAAAAAATGAALALLLAIPALVALPRLRALSSGDEVR